MSRNTRIVLIVVIIILMGIFFVRGCHSNSKPSDEVAASPEVEAPKEEAKPSAPAAKPTPQTSEENPATAPASTPPPIEEDRQALAEKFASEIHKMQTCFSIPPDGEDSLEPTEESLDAAVKPELGDVVAKNTDWTSSYIETPSGEKRLIRAEIDYGSEDVAARKLKYFTVGPDGLLTAIPMPPEQTLDPSDALIASLETEGKVLSRERSTRAYYANGGELNYLERDGVVADIEVTYNGKNFRCMNLQSLSGQCRCY